MVVKQVAPYDPETLLPLPIYPAEDLPPPGCSRNGEGQVVADEHHPNHPGVELEGTVDGVAVRNGSLQWVSYAAHHRETDGYHRFIARAKIPPERVPRFGHTLLNVAECLSKQAIDFRRGEVDIVDLSPRKRTVMRERGDIRVASLQLVRKFWVEHLADQIPEMWEHVDHTKVSDFLAADRERFTARRYTGRLVKDLARLAVDPFNERYKGAYKLGLLKCGIESVPENLVTRVIMQQDIKDIRDILRNRITSELNGELVRS